MPAADYWETFFDADAVVQLLDCAPCGTETVVEFGSGYGTFTLPTARRTQGLVHALDIEPSLIDTLRRISAQQQLSNVVAVERNFVSDGTGLADASVDHAMLFNILHIEDPVALLREAHRVLKPGGTASVIHWIHDPATPRGPSMAIRPRPEQCLAWAADAGFPRGELRDISSAARYHYGVVLRTGCSRQ